MDSIEYDEHDHGYDIEKQTLVDSTVNTPEEILPDTPNRQLELPSQLVSVRCSKDATNYLACKICNAMMSFTITNSSVAAIICWACNKCTPFKKTPAGKIYVRCNCFCLMLCKIGSPEITCIACEEKINVDWSSIKCNNEPLKCDKTCKCHFMEFYSKDVLTIPGIPRLMKTTCSKCSGCFWFPWNSLEVPRPKCPGCGRKYSLELKTAKLYSVLYLLMAGILLTVGHASLMELSYSTKPLNILYIPIACVFVIALKLIGWCIKKMFFTKRVDVIHPDMFE